MPLVGERATRSAGPEVRVATLGAAFSANKGAASMAQAVVDRLPRAVGPCHIDVLSTYPREDRAEQPDGPVSIVSLRPIELVFPVLPICLLVWLVRRIGGSGTWLSKLHPATRSLHRADVVLDLAGISFADGRPFPILVYNVLMTGTPLLLGCPVIKCSQAVGPFDKRLNRTAARLVLPRLRAVLTRGERTHEHATALGLTNAQRADDLAFLMEVPERARLRVGALLKSRSVGSRYVVFAPSAVVKAYCEGIGVDYVAAMAAMIDDIRHSHEVEVVIAPHSARPGKPESRMNDLPVCREVYEALEEVAGVHVLDLNLGPSELRAVIAGSEALVTSRFHAMISALATETPVLVVGWSHKYAEVLEEFGLEDLALAYDDLADPSRMADAVEEFFTRRDDIAERIRAGLPAVAASAHHNLEVVRSQFPSSPRPNSSSPG